MSAPTRVPVALVSYDNGRAKVVKLRGDDAKRSKLVDLLAKRAKRRKSLGGEETANETRDELQDALNEKYAAGSAGADGTVSVWVWARDWSPSWVAFDLSGSGVDEPGTYVAAWTEDEATGDIDIGDPQPVDVHQEYTPKGDDSDLGDVPTLPVYKRGARNSASDLKTIQGMHDGAVSLGAACGMAKSSRPLEPWNVRVGVAKSEAVMVDGKEKQYTFGPLYKALPAKPTKKDLDAHDDAATAADIQDAVWDYVRKGDLRLRDQHTKSVAGDVVEIVCWPWEVTIPVTKADGTVEQKTFAPGSAFMGAIWTDAGWEDVKAGRKTGWSLGGSAYREPIEVDE